MLEYNNSHYQLKITSAQQLKSVMVGDRESRVEALKELLDYPIVQRDPQGSKFWYLRPGENKSAAEETQPIAVGFYDELNQITDKAAKVFITSVEQQLEIYGHYTNRVSEDRPVMYLLLPSGEETGRVALVLPTEGKLRQRQIQTFEWNSNQLLKSRLPRLHYDSLPIAEKALFSTPLIEWVLYDSVSTAKELAEKMAAIARQIEELIPNVYNAESKEGYLHQLFASFQKELLPNLKVSSTDEKEYSFADIYAQTIAYGLFTARVFSYERNEDDLISTEFNRQTAWELLPETNPFLRRLFRDISLRSPQELGDELIEAIVEIISYLRVSKMEVILRDFHQKIDQEDIVIRFYEDFLAAYKPKMRQRRGVYYTPEPVVSYMVRSVDELLKDKLNKPLGIADPEVMILDPACGTGTFLLWIFQLIYKRFQESPDAMTEGLKDKSWSGYVRERLLPRIFGFELLMAPYAIAHLKLGLFLEETGYQFDTDKRLGVYLTNTLEDIKSTESNPRLTLNLPQINKLITGETKAVCKIKKEKPTMIVIGNPPYSGESANKGEWIMKIMEDYKKEPGSKEKLKEQNSKFINDDYVKFLRYGQYYIEEKGEGILSFINPHGFLDNPTFRGMRWNLLKTYDQIYTIDLHGNVKKKNPTSESFIDDNVFDIMQGVSINSFVKIGKNKTNELSQVFHFDLYGKRDIKYDFLREKKLGTVSYKELSIKTNYYFFVPKNFELQEEYEKGFSIDEIFSVSSLGILTKNDLITIKFEEKDLDLVLDDFETLDFKNLRNKYNIKPDTRDWQILKAIDDIKYHRSKISVSSIAYRPFDIRKTFLSGNSKGFVSYPQNKIRKHFVKKNNIGLVTNRQLASLPFTHCFITNIISDQCYISSRTKEGGTVYPLYLYFTNNEQRNIENQKRIPNLNEKIIKKIAKKLGLTFTNEKEPLADTFNPIDLLNYIYAILHSPTYRDRYAEFLKIKFPQIPFTSNNKLFHKLVEYGEQLVQLHLMTSPKLDNLITEFIKGEGDRQKCSEADRTVNIGSAKKAYSKGTVKLNKKGDRFTGVPEEVWNFYIGGYQVCHKWLKDRKDRTLSDEDILHYQKIVVSLKETIELMKKIDQAIPSFPIQ